MIDKFFPSDYIIGKEVSPMNKRDENGKFQSQLTCVRGHVLSETAVYHPSRPGERACSQCKLLITQEWRDKNRARVRATDNEWRKNNIEKARASERKWYYKNREKKLAAGRIRYHKTKEIKKWQTITRKYNLTKDDFDKLFESQGKRCPICWTSEFTQWTLNVDHCHVSGKVRGILCNKCNLGLGAFDENPDTMSRAIDYVALHAV
jgi:RNA polymerase subunit RPABC4/transcription elongation factor Spt4